MKGLLWVIGHKGGFSDGYINAKSRLQSRLKVINQQYVSKTSFYFISIRLPAWN